MSGSDKIAEILGDWLLRKERGEAVDPEDVVRAHPDLSDELRARFAAMRIADHVFAGAPAPPVIAEYRIVREIGRGGMGVVYEAEQVSMRRKVALKVLFPSVTSSPKAVKRFQQEAWAAGCLKHTNIVGVYQLGHEAGTWYCAMELVEGRPLSDVIAELGRSRPPRESRLGRRALGVTKSGLAPNTATGTRAYYARVAEMFAEVAEALEVAHDKGVIHRDVKPANLLLDAEGRLKLVDFGLARLEEGASAMTVTGEMLGTPLYMSPEQIAGGHGGVDGRTDIYSLGATLYEALTLRPPFRSENVQRLAAAILSGTCLAPRRWNRAIPRDLETIILKATDVEPARRYRSAAEMAHDLRAFSLGDAIRARRISPLARVWRAIRRQPVRAALAGGLLIAGGAAAALWTEGRAKQMRFEEEAHRRKELQYSMLCVQAEQEAIREMSESAQERGRRSGELYERAVVLAPDRFEAYLSRSLSPRYPLRDRLGDIEAAASRGAPPRVVHLARAWILESLGRSTEADRERALADRHVPDDAYALFLEGVLAALRGDREAALALLTDAVARAPVGSSVGYLARWHRSLVLEDRFDYVAALADLYALEAAGDRGIVLRTRIASLWRRLGRDAEAATLFDEIRRAAISPDQRQELCVACDVVGEADWLERAALDALEAEPESVRFLLHAAQACKRLSRPDDALRHCERALELAPDSHAAHELKGAILLHKRDWQASLEATRKAMGIADCWACRVNASIALRELRQLDEALGECRRALELDPRQADAHESLSATLLAKGDLQAALDAADRALELKPRLASAHSVRAEVLAAQRRLDEALDEIDLALRIESSAGRYHRQRGVILCEEGDFEAALAAYGQALALGDFATECQLGRGEALRLLGRPAEALAAFQLASEADPRDARPHVNRAIVFRDQKRYEEAADACRRATELAPDWFLARFDLASILYDAKRWDEVLAAVDGALGAAEHSEARDGYSATELVADLHDYKGLALTMRGDQAGAAAEWQQALALGKRTARVYLNAAATLFALGKAEEALAQVDGALAEGVESADLHALRAAVLGQRGDLKGALAASQRAIDLDPDCESAQSSRAMVLSGLGQEQEAKAAFEEAGKRFPEGWRLLSNFAWLLATARSPEVLDPERAASIARSVVAKHSDFAPGWNTLGVALCRKGEWQEALRALQRSMDLQSGGDASDWFFVAIALHRLTRVEEAKGFLAKAVAWTEEHAPDDPDLKRFRAEAEAVLGDR